MMETTHNTSINKLIELNTKVANNIATKEEKDELMYLLFQRGSINEKQYNDYTAGRNSEQLLKTALIIAGIILVAYLLERTLK